MTEDEMHLTSAGDVWQAEEDRERGARWGRGMEEGTWSFSYYIREKKTQNSD